jgi:hypothetical protein
MVPAVLEVQVVQEVLVCIWVNTIDAASLVNTKGCDGGAFLANRTDYDGVAS